MVSRRVHRGNILVGRTWSPKQAEALRCTTPNLYIDGGRQFGKSYVGAACFNIRLHKRIAEAKKKIRRGEMLPWAGIDKPTNIAAQIPPTVQAWVLTPRSRHIEQCRGYIGGYYGGAFKRLLHPHHRMQSRDGGREMWLLIDGVAAKVRYAPASGWRAVTGSDVDLIWIDEAGLLESTIWDALQPLLWARDGELIATGTPSLGVEHWFSAGCLSGLDKDHPYYQGDVIERDPSVTTIIGTSYEAYNANVRRRARLDARKNGEAWESQWVLGDWRLPDVFVYSEWDAKTHIVDYDPDRHTLNGRKLPRPTGCYGLIDWSYSSSKPGACVVFHWWAKNPLDKERRQPLVIAVKDAQERMTYTADGWYRIFRRYRERYNVQLWYADPSMNEMIVTARKMRIGRVKPAEKADKAGRVNLVRSLLHHDGADPPALYVSSECEHLPRQFENWQYKLDRDGQPTDTPRDYDDHCLDCVAFLVGVIMPRGTSVPNIQL